MRAYIIRRLLLVIPTLLLVTVIVFFLVRLVPGDVVDIMATTQETTTGMDVDMIRHQLGLDVPVPIQYGRWVGVLPGADGSFSGVFQGNLGNSLWTHRPVTEGIFGRLPISYELALMAITIGLLISLPVGIYSAIRQDTWGDYIGRSVAIAMITLPGFWIATMVMVFPSIWWHWSPAMEYIPFTENPIGNLSVLIVPAAILGMLLSGTTMRMTRTMMLEVLRQDYVRTAWAKGLTERVVVIRHALKNALIPVVTIVGLQLPILIGGSMILEQIFNIPGIGLELIRSITNRDYPVLSGINLITAGLVLLINLVVDLTYAYLDPRIYYK